tara:strand:- start:368 stop:1375 length:1008 start_codon:yes stop_codon:yes gene_type:complete
MDPISQGAVGALAAQASARTKHITKITLIGCLAGLAPDLDVLIQSPEDPILFLEYHRQFSHSLIFIPFGSLIVAVAVSAFFKGSINFKTIYFASFMGYATHGLLDACTSYGTQLFWPFSTERVSWNNISIVDPLFTLPVIFLIIVALKTKKKLISLMAVGWSVIYLSLGLIQYERTLSAAIKLADSRGHNAQRLTLKPSFGNIVLWKAIYQTDKNYYVDAIRTTYSSQWCSGTTIEKFEYDYHTPLLDRKSQQGKDIERFRWFSQDYLGFDSDSSLITDIRYSMLPNEVSPMWGLDVDYQRQPNAHASWWASRELSQKQLLDFRNMITGKSCSLL